MKERYRFFGPIVQIRVPESDRLDRRISALRKTKKYDDLKRMLDGALKTFDGLMSRGFIPSDSMPSNFCLFDGVVHLCDLGAIWKKDSHVDALLLGDKDQLSFYVKRNAYCWIKAISGGMGLGVDKTLDSLMSGFNENFQNFFSRDHCARLSRRKGPLHKRLSIPVPDIFPLSSDR